MTNSGYDLPCPILDEEQPTAKAELIILPFPILDEILDELPTAKAELVIELCPYVLSGSRLLRSDSSDAKTRGHS